MQRGAKQLELFEPQGPAGAVSAWTTLAEAQRAEVVTTLARVIAKTFRPWAKPRGTQTETGVNDE